MSWTDERVDLLKKLWAEGLSASQIAGRIGGVTRNAVIGKVHRLGLAGRATTTRSRSPSRPRSRANMGPRRPRSRFAMGNASMRELWQWQANQQQEAVEVVEEIVIPLEERKSILQLKESDCRWPIGDPQAPEFHFCGRAKHEGLPYCEFHARKAFQPPQAPRRRGEAEVGPLIASAWMPKKISAA
jgi:GcrA cell cycle regulator